MDNCKSKSFRDCHKFKNCLTDRFSIWISELAERSMKMHAQKGQLFVSHTHLHRLLGNSFNQK